MVWVCVEAREAGAWGWACPHELHLTFSQAPTSPCFPEHRGPSSSMGNACLHTHPRWRDRLLCQQTASCLDILDNEWGFAIGQRPTSVGTDTTFAHRHQLPLKLHDAGQTIFISLVRTALVVHAPRIKGNNASMTLNSWANSKHLYNLWCNLLRLRALPFKTFSEGLCICNNADQ